MAFGSNRRLAWFSWLSDDLGRAVALLKKKETWIVIGVAIAFGVLGGVSLYFSTGLDISLQMHHMQIISCSSASNLQSAAIIVGGMAFAMAGIAAFGELANYIDDKRRYRARASGRNAIIVTALALVAGAGLLWLMLSICG